MRTRTNPVHHRLTLLIGSAAAAMLIAGPACADPFSFSTGNPDGKIATASRPDAGGLFEIESADDFVLTAHTSLTSATFTGLVTSATGTTPTIGEVRVEIYQVFPKSSDVGRTSGPPTFSTSQVPTRVNSPSDVALDDRDSTSGGLTFMTTGMGTFTASNSVQPGGIHPTPGQTTWWIEPITISPEADVSGIGGTLSGNALSLAAIRATLGEVLTDDAFDRMIPLAERWTDGVAGVIAEHELAWTVQRLGCRAEYWFCPPPRNGGEAAAAVDHELDALMHLYALNRGVLLTPFHNMALMSPATTERRRRSPHRGVRRRGGRAARLTRTSAGAGRGLTPSARRPSSRRRRRTRRPPRTGRRAAW